MDGRLKVAVVVPHIGRGGGARTSATVIARALSGEHNTTILTLKRRRNSRAGTAKDLYNGRVESLGIARVKGRSLRARLTRLVRPFQVGRAVAEFCRREEIDVAVGVLTNTALILSRLLYRNPARLVLSVRNNPEGYEFKRPAPVRPLYRLAFGALYRRAEAVVAITAHMQHILETRYRISRVRLIYNMYAGIGGSRAAGSSQGEDPGGPPVVGREPSHALSNERADGERLWITVGRMSRQKGHLHLVRAFADLAAEVPSVRLAIVGSGLLEGEVRRLVEELDLGDRVSLLGKRFDVPQLLQRAELFILCSLWEGLPLSLLEALEMRLPVVATDCPTGPREVLAPETAPFEPLEYPYFGTYGILTPHIGPYRSLEELSGTPLDAAERTLAETLRRIAHEPERTRERYAHGPRRTEDFAFETVGAQWRKLVAEIAGKVVAADGRDANQAQKEIRR